MYDAIVLGPVVIKYSLLIMIASFLIVFLTFRLISPFDQKTIKAHLNTIGDLLLMIFFTIIGAKIILNIQLFLNEPIAVLSYPSDSKALYIASIVVIGRIFWLIKKKKIIWRPFFDSMTRFMLFSHFISLFGMMFFSSQSVLLYQIATHFILLVILISFGKDRTDSRFIPLIIVSFGLAHAILGLILPVVFFGYHVSLSYYILIAMIGIYQFYQVMRVGLND